MNDDRRFPFHLHLWTCNKWRHNKADDTFHAAFSRWPSFTFDPWTLTREHMGSGHKKKIRRKSHLSVPDDIWSPPNISTVIQSRMLLFFLATPLRLYLSIKNFTFRGVTVFIRASVNYSTYNGIYIINNKNHKTYSNDCNDIIIIRKIAFKPNVPMCLCNPIIKKR